MIMKGMIFTEFLEMVEAKFSPDMLDRIFETADLPSGGAYTTVGTYDHAEMVELVTCLSRETGVSAPDLVRTFGTYLFERFRQTFPMYFEGVESTFDFLRQVPDYIHVEVRKLYPDAELPSFAHETPAPDRFVLVYHSSRPFSVLAEGLIKGCVAHFGEQIELAVEDLSGGRGTSARFSLTKRAAAA
jgi:Haem-NO-binding